MLKRPKLLNRQSKLIASTPSDLKFNSGFQSESKNNLISDYSYKKLNKNYISNMKDCSLFSELKSKEKETTSDRNRKVSDYNENYSIGLSLPLSSEEIRKTINNPSDLLDATKDHVTEHAARRVDIFFYVLVAYYQSNLVPIQGDTKLQHGSGRRIKKKIGLTHACHSSFFPTLIDETIHNVIIKGKSLSFNKKNSTIKQSLLDGTHFYDNMNSTMELPLFVNNLDYQLEGKIEIPSVCRQNALNIIRMVSSGDINPIQGLVQYLKTMSDTFNDLEFNKKSVDVYLSRDSINSPKFIKPKLIELERIGTIKNKWLDDKQTVSFDYIDLLLRLTPAEKSICKQGLEKRNKVYFDKIKEIQKEILTTKSEFKLT